MPKRKTPDFAGASGTSGARDAIASPNPRKKSKQEALAAAKQWHDRRNHPTKKVAGVDRSAAVPTAGVNGAVTASRADVKTGKPAASKVPGAASVDAKKQPVPDKKSSQSALFDDANATKSKRGNAFLQSLRGSKNSAGDAANASSAVPANGAASNANCGSTIYLPNNESATNKAKKRSLLLMDILVILCLVAINAVAGYFVYDHQVSITNSYEQHAIEIEKLKGAISESRDVEAVLQSGINVLVAKQQRWKLLRDAAAEYSIRVETGGDGLDVQTPDEKNNWSELMRFLSEDKRLASTDLDLKLAEHGIHGSKE